MLENFHYGDGLRDVLDQLDIDINSVSNGVPLLPEYHRKFIHFDTEEYIDAITPRILAKVPYGRAAVEAELEAIGKALFDRAFTLPD